MAESGYTGYACCGANARDGHTRQCLRAKLEAAERERDDLAAAFGTARQVAGEMVAERDALAAKLDRVREYLEDFRAAPAIMDWTELRRLVE